MFGRKENHKGPMTPEFSQIMISFTIDDLVYKHGMPAPNFVKLDVDGLEYEILKGARKTLSSSKFTSLIMESCVMFSMSDVSAYLEDCGLRQICEINYPERNGLTTDYIFSRVQ